VLPWRCGDINCTTEAQGEYTANGRHISSPSGKAGDGAAGATTFWG
jgi:hypothetical protein